MVANGVIDSFNMEKFTYALVANDCYCGTRNSPKDIQPATFIIPASNGYLKVWTATWCPYEMKLNKLKER